jgi:hypothetical protein
MYSSVTTKVKAKQQSSLRQPFFFEKKRQEFCQSLR